MDPATLQSGPVFALRMGYCRRTVGTCLVEEGTSADRGFWGTRVAVPLFPNTFPQPYTSDALLPLGRLIIGIGTGRVVGRINDLADLRECLPNRLLNPLIQR